MECTDTSRLSNAEYFKWFNNKSSQLRVPLSGSIDLTHRCNLRCVHCYIDHPDKNSPIEMNTDRILSLINEITDAGCLDLLISGGEPLMHKDFIDIYTHIKRNGILVSVFTNGTLITDSIISLFKELPPQTVEISLYGATAPTYEKITGVKESFKRCLKGIQNLLDNKINVKLKTILMTLNQHEFFDMENIAKDFGVKFRFDPAIFPCFTGDKSPINLRVSPEEAIEKEFSNDERRRDWKDFFKRYKDSHILDTIYYCGAGITDFYIDPYGNLQPCLMPTDLIYNLNEGDFLTGWNTVIPLILEKKPASDYACIKCESRMLCGYCPAFFRLENDSEDIPSEYLCAMGKYRFQMIQNIG